MPKGTKKSPIAANPNRYFFTATEEIAAWIEKGADQLCLDPPAFIRMKLHQAMKAETDGRK